MNNKKIILIIASMAMFIEALDIAIINLAIPSIQRTLTLTNQQAQWLQTFYILCYGVFLIPGGRLSDAVGNKKMFVTGCSLFLLASFGAGLSGYFPVLLAARALQGLAAAIVMPSAFSIVNSTFTGEGERARAMGIFSSFAAIGSGGGLALGGIITNYLGWQWIFFINVPVLLIVIIAALKFLAQRTSAHSNEPIIDISLFRIPSLMMGNAAFILLGAFFTGYLFLVSLILQGNMGCSAARAGFTLVPFSILSVMVARFLLPVFTSRFSINIMAIIGMCCMLAGGMLLLAAANYNMLWLLLCAAAFIAGLGITICFTSFSVLSMQDVPAKNYGVGSAMTSTAYFLGGSIGLPMLTLFMPASAATAKVTGAPVLMLCLYAVAGVAGLCIYNFVRSRAAELVAE